MAAYKSKLLSLVIVLSGCAAYQKVPIDGKTAAALKGQTITYTARKMPNFELYTASNNGQGAFQELARISEGNEVVAKNGIADPTAAVAMGVLKALENSRGARPATSPVALEGADDVSRVAALAGTTARFVVDVKTIKWNANWSTPFGWTSGYRILYLAGARLLDVQTKAVVAEGGCKYFPEAGANDPKYDELLANGAERLKQEMGKAVAECLSQLRSEMLSLPGTPP